MEDVEEDETHEEHKVACKQTFVATADRLGGHGTISGLIRHVLGFGGTLPVVFGIVLDRGDGGAVDGGVEFLVGFHGNYYYIIDSFYFIITLYEALKK